MPEIVRTKPISKYIDNPLAGHIGIEKTQELIARKYYYPIIITDIEFHIKGYEICLALIYIRHKLYGDLQSIFAPSN